MLLIDNSNTVTKLALAPPGGKPLPPGAEVRRLPTAALTPAALREATAGWDIRAVCLSSVVPAATRTIAAHFHPLPLHALSHRSRLPMPLDYPRPEQIGADRLANAAAVHALDLSLPAGDRARARRAGGAPALRRPSIVIDFGTAVTFDVLGEDGAYLGGVIAPGLAALTDHLHRNTALLPRVELAEPPSAIGKSTEHAMQAGALIGYRGLIRGILAALREELPRPPLVIATGGHAPLLAAKMPEIRSVHPLLTLQGILAIARLNLPPQHS